MKNYSLLALMFSILMFMIVSCGDNGTNTITPKNKPGQLGGTAWKFIADVNVKTGGMINTFFEEFDFDNKVMNTYTGIIMHTLSSSASCLTR